MKKLFLILILLAIAIPSYAADVTVGWDAVTGATGCKIYRSTDLGVTWTQAGEALRTEAGAWINQSWKAPEQPSGTGIE